MLPARTCAICLQIVSSEESHSVDTRTRQVLSSAASAVNSADQLLLSSILCSLSSNRTACGDCDRILIYLADQYQKLTQIQLDVQNILQDLAASKLQGINAEDGHVGLGLKSEVFDDGDVEEFFNSLENAAMPHVFAGGQQQQCDLPAKERRIQSSGLRRGGNNWSLPPISVLTSFALANYFIRPPEPAPSAAAPNSMGMGALRHCFIRLTRLDPNDYNDLSKKNVKQSQTGFISRRKKMKSEFSTTTKDEGPPGQNQPIPDPKVAVEDDAENDELGYGYSPSPSFTAMTTSDSDNRNTRKSKSKPVKRKSKVKSKTDPFKSRTCTTTYNTKSKVKSKADPFKSRTCTTYNTTNSKMKSKGKADLFKSRVVYPDSRAVLIPGADGKLRFGNFEVDVGQGGYGEFKCVGCDKYFTSRGGLIAHMRQKHAERVTFICDNCGKRFKNTKAFKRHMKFCKEGKFFECNVCGHPFKSSTAARQHAYTHKSQEELEAEIKAKQSVPYAIKALCPEKRKSTTGTGDLKHSCDVCGKSFAFKSKLQEHLIQHMTSKIVPCPDCTATFKTNGCLKNHQRNIHWADHRKFECRTCLKGFPTVQQYRLHARTHTAEKAYQCTVCGKFFVSRATVSAHTKNVHSAVKLYPCDGCGRRFRWGNGLRVHIKNGCTDRRFKNHQSSELSNYFIP